MIDVGLPKTAGLRMALESAQDREYHGAVNRDAMFGGIPVRICIIYMYKGGNGRSRGVGKSILGVATEDSVGQTSSKGKEQALDRLFNT